PGEVRLHERADGPAVDEPRRRADAALEAERGRAGARAHAALGHGATRRAVERGEHVCLGHGARAHVAEQAVVRLADDGVEGARRLVPRAGQYVRDQGVRRPERAERRGEQHGRLDRAELGDLRGADQLAEAVADEEAAGQAAPPRAESVGDDRGDTRVQPRRVGDRRVPHAHPWHVGERVVRSGGQRADDDPQLTRPARFLHVRHAPSMADGPALPRRESGAVRVARSDQTHWTSCQTMPFASVNWQKRSPQGAGAGGGTTSAPAAEMRANSASRSSTWNAIGRPWPAGPAMRSGLNVLRPTARNTMLTPAVGWLRDTKPSADMASLNPRCRVAKSAEAATSGTLSERAVAVIFKRTPHVVDNSVQRTT